MGFIGLRIFKVKLAIIVSSQGWSTEGCDIAYLYNVFADIGILICPDHESSGCHLGTFGQFFLFRFKKLKSRRFPRQIFRAINSAYNVKYGSL